MLNVKFLFLWWLTVLPILEQGFHLNKQEFQDALWLRYGWELSRVPSHCVCGASFSAYLTFIHHNELRDLTVSWLHEVYHDVAIKPPLQPLNGETVAPAWADIYARGFWGRQHSAF